jgi:hypothetical protein
MLAAAVDPDARSGLVTEWAAGRFRESRFLVTGY